MSAGRVVDQKVARFTGFLFLFAMSTGIFGELFVRGSLIVRGDGSATIANILGAERFYRLGAVADLATFFSVVVIAWGLYWLLKPTCPRLSMLALTLRSVEAAVHVGAVIATMAVLVIVRQSETASGFTPSQLGELVIMGFRVQGIAMGIGFIFLGAGSGMFAFGLLRSRLIPVPIAIVGLFASFCMLAISVTSLIFPEARAYQLVVMAPMFVYEVTLGTWLLFRGVHQNT